MTSKDQRTMKQTSTLPASWNDLTLLAGSEKWRRQIQKKSVSQKKAFYHTYAEWTLSP
jgi:hypothetical protein